ncbi:hypothetical protein HOLleu_42972 [Holothuria leucospilota]|uniref:Reverse transcriptase domain-containing protein n=1 Tax=Holothuria leucospilota TaxID=206669 RepID=A0A9Q0YCF2_HOLLE|nr:hypothetical protein HOLleu_42972 [Holothuria leucospilota]
MGSRNSTRLQNSFLKGTSSAVPSIFSNQSRKSKCSGHRNSTPTAEKGSGESSRAENRATRVSKYFVCGPKERRRRQARLQFKEPKFLSRTTSFQDGRDSHSKRVDTKRGLHGEDRSKGCLPVYPNCQESQKLSKVSVERNQVSVLQPSFGLATAPLVFTKLLKPVVSHLRQQGIRLIVYLDDFLFLNQSSENLVEEMSIAKALLENLGFTINQKKSIFVPSKTVEFLGLSVESESLQLSLPANKLSEIKKECQKMLTLKSVKARTIAHLVGKMVAAKVAINYSMAHLRYLQRVLGRAIQGPEGFEEMTQVPEEGAYKDLKWWIENIQAQNGRAIQSLAPDLIIQTDASLSGWGAVCGGSRTGGLWLEHEKTWHINVLDLQAIYLALNCFTKNISNQHILIKSDNVSALSYINRQGGTKSKDLLKVVDTIWEFCQVRQLTLTGEHVPGILNGEADCLSRHWEDASDWMLNKQIFNQIAQTLGPFQIDLFASRTNAQCPVYCSWKPDPGSQWVNGFTLTWTNLAAYVFPPFILIARCLRKVREWKATVCLVTPKWTTQPWYAQALEMSVQSPILIPPKNFRGNLTARGLSEEDQTLITSSWRKGTSDQYDCVWKFFSGWCSEREINPFCASLEEASNFLAEQFEKGKSYSTLNIYRSALSATLPPIDGKPLGQHPLICRLLKGVSIKRPPQAKYSFTWDVQVVLDYIKSLGANSDLSLKLLSKKAVVLVALATGCRGSEIAKMVTNLVKIDAEKVQVGIMGATKTSKPGQTKICILPFLKVTDICPASVFRHYLERTKSFRSSSNDEDNVFISFLKPYRKVCSATIARWIKDILRLAGVDTGVFTAHFTRGASTSAALRAGMAVEDIMKVADWTRVATFKNFISGEPLLTLA